MRPLLCIAALCLAFGLALAVVPTHARGAGATVDGISDQSLPDWDGGFSGSSFAQLFRAQWVDAGRIRYARYVVQWNAMAPGHGGERAQLEAWLGDVAGLGLTPDLALTSYDGVYPASSGEYALRLSQLLGRARRLAHPIPYVEAWNEPDNQGREPAAVAAGLADAAHALCAAGGYGCTVIAGDFEDGPGLVAYERAYQRNLDFAPAIWGVHPYLSVQDMSEAPYLRFLGNLPRQGAGAEVWITEVAARRCTDYGGLSRGYGEAGQARRAAWLVDTLLPNRSPANTFYYEFLLAGRRQPGCSVGEPEDDALYEPPAPPSLLDRPRAAAGIVWAGGAAIDDAGEAHGGGGGPAAGEDGPALDPQAPPLG
ncbi:MAG TPA: hypothetical protein VMU32_05580 [Solirubrobacteraceae bacterium]|nr:hypothetical protein [Solirubrobacteraceae bacterium]